MKTHKVVAGVLGAAIMLSSTPALAATALTASCAGVPTPTSITWTASTSGGIAPLTYLWGNGSTLATQTVSALPGTHSITLQVTDASSTVAVATCSTTLTAVPSVASSTTIVALNTQIKSVREQIHALTKQLKDLLRQKWNLLHTNGISKGDDHGKKSKESRGRDSHDD